ncbi:MAG: RNB domain-containing ribonuclease [Burkholderiales bacterium]|jgi:exoribonuclease-2|nr:RNB domain-containing ribonuclease [Burkholderiales bacterium]
MHVFFEDDGQLKIGSILSELPASLQVEIPSGRRLKLRSDRVLFRFAQPAPAEALKEAQTQEIDPDFLWEVCPDGEFSFETIAADYFGADVSPSQKMAMATILFSSPVHFYKKGRGYYKKAPLEALNAARASLERKAREKAQMDAWHGELIALAMPEALRKKLSMLLYKPDKNALEYKAFSVACETLKMQPAKLAQACGVLSSEYEYHFHRFLAHAFPHGTDFPEQETIIADTWTYLPLADVQAFSIDDRTTTEFDDAFSVHTLTNGHNEIGIHIAAPALAVTRGSALDMIARSRLSTVYMPGHKITMLPDEVIDVFTLKAGNTPPALSLYIEIDERGAPINLRTELNRITIAANLRFEDIDESFTENIAEDRSPYTSPLRILWRFVQYQAQQRGKTEVERTEYSFYIDWDAAPEGVVSILPRRRGAPLDRLIAECAIFVNNQWGELLARHNAAGLYRTQKQGRVRMSTRPGEHQGLGVSYYLWATSPLRRYSDLINQRQLFAVLNDDSPPLQANDGELLAILSDFESTYRQYAEFQSDMERYWCLRWLIQEEIETAEAVVLKRPHSARLTRIPLYLKLADLPDMAPGRIIQVSLANIDLLFSAVEARFLKALDQFSETVDLDELSDIPEERADNNKGVF